MSVTSDRPKALFFKGQPGRKADAVRPTVAGSPSGVHSLKSHRFGHSGRCGRLQRLLFRVSSIDIIRVLVRLSLRSKRITNPVLRSDGARRRKRPAMARAFLGHALDLAMVSPTASDRRLKRSVAVPLQLGSFAIKVRNAIASGSASSMFPPHRRDCPHRRTRNLPGGHKSPSPQATAQRQKSAILGCRSRRVEDRRCRPIETASSNAPRRRGSAALNSSQISRSGRLRSSAIASRLRKSARSARSGRVTTSSIPFRMTGRHASKSTSSLSAYSSRAWKPPPVEMRQSKSASQGGMFEMLSNASRWPLFAAMKRSRSSRGNDRNGAA